MNKILVVLTMLTLIGATSISYADGVIIPVSVKVNEFKKEMKLRGMDLSGEDYSDGTIENRGTSIKVITYKPVTIEQMDLMKEVAFKTVRK